MKLTKDELKRYSRHILLPEIGEQGQEKLKAAKVLVIGAGGLGSPVLLYLAAAGVGNIGVIDFDSVDETNLQRQILFDVGALGKNKALEAKKRLEKLNPFVSVTAYAERLTTKNALELFEQYDMIIDGTDNFATRYLVNDACILTGKPLVYGSIYRFEGQVSVFNYTDQEGNRGPTYRCLFPTPPPPEAAPNCSQIGVLGVLPGFIGTQQANEAIKLITGIGAPLSGKLLLMNTLTNQFTTLKIKRNETAVRGVLNQKEEFEKIDYKYFCNPQQKPDVKEVLPVELQQWLSEKEALQLLDVREPHETPKVDELEGLQIPLGELPDSIEKVDREKKTVVYCQSGIRSRSAIRALEKEGFKNLFNLQGGVLNWLDEIADSIQEEQH